MSMEEKHPEQVYEEERQQARQLEEEDKIKEMYFNIKKDGDKKLIQNDNIIISIVEDDITDMSTHVIVNPTNRSLSHFGGIAGDLCRKGGPKI